MKDLNTVLREGNSTENQWIKSQFVDREVFCNVNSLVEPFISSYEMENAPFSIDDIENYFIYPEHNGKELTFQGGTQELFDDSVGELESLLAELEEKLEDLDTDEDNEETNRLKERIADLEDELNEFRDLETEPQEIFEWWAISDMLYKDLQAAGEPVIHAGSCYIWGRTTTGQAILLDACITEICAKMEILEGQRNEWRA